ncbi:MAG TPA: DUF6798 domain-containing protein [Bryobacteraceae bacterium]|nr:DUF6798 domain-containing protein [Bryobacteraceae bacterium]
MTNADRVFIGAFLVLITALTFYFPGHTWLQADTQIYAALMEHIEDPAALSGDFLVERSHLEFTLYDEITIALHRLSHASFEAVLLFQQAVLRLAGVVGVYLIAAAFPLSRKMALFVAALASLGTLIAGPAVLTLEYEPTPRAFALPLSLLAIGLAAEERPMAASIAGSVALLYHAPTAAPFWILFFAFLFARRNYRALAPLAAAAAILMIASRLQQGAVEHQAFLWRIPAEVAAVQRFRAAYNWIETWGWRLLAQYVVLWAIAMFAYWRVRPKRGSLFLVGLPLLGLFSIPFSWLTLDVLKWGFIPQFQPARAALFITLFAIVLAAAAGVRAAQAGRYAESAAWFVVPYLPSLQPQILDMFLPPFGPLAGRRWLVAIILAVASVAAVRLSLRPAWHLAILGFAAVPFFAIPLWGRVVNYPPLHTPELQQLVAWASRNAPRNAIFVFPDAGRKLYPGVFRVEAERPLYVDWKSGGQANYYEWTAMEWSRRWRQINSDPPAALCRSGVDFIVLQRAHRLTGAAAVYDNGAYVVYSCRDQAVVLR